jgi:hypothetical protein
MFTWTLLQSSDLKSYVKNLRAVRCPEETVRAIIMAEVGRQFAPREQAVKSRREDYRPWEAPPKHPVLAFERQRRIRALVREKKALLEALLGYPVQVAVPEAAARPGQGRYEAAYLRLPEQKREGVRAVQELYWDRADDLKARTLGYLEADDLQELKRLKTERRASLKSILSAPELEDFDLETSTVAGLLRSRMAEVDATDQELRQVFRRITEAEEGMLVEAVPLQLLSRARSGKEQGIQQALEPHIRAALGEARYAELQGSRRH